MECISMFIIIQGLLIIIHFYFLMQTTGVPKQAAEKLQAEIDHLKAELGLSE